MSFGENPRNSFLVKSAEFVKGLRSMLRCSISQVKCLIFVMFQGLHFRLGFSKMTIKLQWCSDINTRIHTMSKQANKVTQVQHIALTGKHPEKPFRNGTARQLYWQDLQARCAKGSVPVADVAAVWGDAKQAPKLPKSGKVEPPAGWMGYFCRIGVATLKVVEVPVTAK